MMSRNFRHAAGVLWLSVGLFVTAVPGHAQTIGQSQAAFSGSASQVVRWVVMKDALGAERLKNTLESGSPTGFPPGSIVPGYPRPSGPFSSTGLTFAANGNYLLVMGSQEAVDAQMGAVRLLAFLMEQPRAHLMLNARVVQITGTTNAEVVQTAETVRSLVNAQREELLRTFADLEGYLSSHLREPQSKGAGGSPRVATVAEEILPSLGSRSQPLSMPAILLLATLDGDAGATGRSPRAASTRLAIRPGTSRGEEAGPLSRGAAPDAGVGELLDVTAQVQDARDWCRSFAAEVRKGRPGVQRLRTALAQDEAPLPERVSRELLGSLELTERLQPGRVQQVAERALRDLERQFELRLQRAEGIARSGAQATGPPSKGAGTPRMSAAQRSAVRSLAEELSPRPLALFRAVAAAAGNSPERAEQLTAMLREYITERRKVDDTVRSSGSGASREIDFEKMQRLEAQLNLWLRRSSEAMAQSLDEQFYRRYNLQLRLLADRQYGKTVRRQLMAETSLDEVPGLTLDLLEAGRGTNIFVSNTISMQCTPGQSNTVSAQVQASLPEKKGVQERLSEANAVASALQSLNNYFPGRSWEAAGKDRPLSPERFNVPGIDPSAIVQAILAGGEAIPVTDGMTLAAEPTIGFDASTITLKLSFQQSLTPGESSYRSPTAEDRVVSHAIGTEGSKATITALSYEPMVLSTLTGNISYTARTGGIPVLRKLPGLRGLLGDIPAPPFKEHTRQRGIYQCSIIILEPVVIPTIEDLYVFHGGAPATVLPEVPPVGATREAGRE